MKLKELLCTKGGNMKNGCEPSTPGMQFHVIMSSTYDPFKGTH
jgi:hypothetical protein